MCLIIDVNIAHKVFFDESDPDFGAIHRGLFPPPRGPAKKPRLRMVYGGKLAQEYPEEIRRIVRQLDAAGRARTVDDAQIEEELAVVTASGLCRSNDQHIIALARASGVRLLCSEDDALCQDFKNPKLLKPRGSVYRKASHKHLLMKHCGHLSD